MGGTNTLSSFCIRIFFSVSPETVETILTCLWHIIGQNFKVRVKFASLTELEFYDAQVLKIITAG